MSRFDSYCRSKKTLVVIKHPKLDDPKINSHERSFLCLFNIIEEIIEVVKCLTIVSIHMTP